MRRHKGQNTTLLICVLLISLGAMFVVCGTVLALLSPEIPQVSQAPSRAETSESTSSFEESADESREESRDESENDAFGALKDRYLSLADNLDEKAKALANEKFLDYIILHHGEGVIERICLALEDGSYTPEMWHDLTGYTITVQGDFFNLRLEPSSEQYDPYICYKGNSKTDGLIRLGFGGDFSFADNYYVGKAYASRDGGLDAIIDPALVSMMKEHDLMTVNCEFALTNEKTALKGKRFVFRAAPEQAWIFNALGIELVTLGNNHVFDYGEQGFYDTLSALKDAGIKYIGAGENLDEATQAWYFIINGRKVAYLNGYRANEGAITYTPGASETGCGVNYAFDSKKMSAVVRETKANCDILVLYMHWGREDVTTLETAIKVQGKEYIDAGADVIVGCHTHVAQGIEIYGEHVIFYSMGNFLFNFKELDSCLVTVEIDLDGNIINYYTPLLQKRTKIWLTDSAVAQRIRDKIMSISIGAAINSDNSVTRKQQ